MATSTSELPGARASRPPVLRVRGLDVRFTPTGRAPVVAATGVDLDVRAGELVALLGESGSGKTVTARAVMGIQDPAATVTARELSLSGVDLLGMDEAARRRIRGERMSMVLQDALSSLNPVLTVGDQIGEVFRVHRGLSRRQARARAVELLDLVGIARPGSGSTTTRTSSPAACASASSSRWRSRSSPSCSSPTSPPRLST
ncbi:ATP-binding cassette domain-containing protein [Cellulomonas sp. ATA003]|uniref:ATP-binding cassette domain-containing protein n=1 Tax=Cellulomonas sp. ATA003 TaxID=3073064 RepID=UPI002873104D|nr:ATP-binding cassette domain-containing protein [Cellulomonas sp. ATA003]WNB86512.1 ATP-binding cassette domain-containing protein [Cellulomonas sp. ATA003]